MSAESTDKKQVMFELIESVEALEPDAAAALVDMAKRLVNGQKEHGPLHLSTDSRDWTENQWEEIVDRMFYRVCQRRQLALRVSEDWPTSPLLANLIANQKQAERRVQEVASERDNALKLLESVRHVFGPPSGGFDHGATIEEEARRFVERQDFATDVLYEVRSAIGAGDDESTLSACFRVVTLAKSAMTAEPLACGQCKYWHARGEPYSSANIGMCRARPEFVAIPDTRQACDKFEEV
jgi:hypothetical protein